MRPCTIGHRAPQAGEAEPVLAGLRELHFDYGAFLPANSKKCDAGIRERPFGNRRPSERKLITGAPLGLAGGNPQRS
jgi:hypothetical protein